MNPIAHFVARESAMKILLLIVAATACGCITTASLTDTRGYKYEAEKQACLPDSRYGLIYGGVRGDVDFMATATRGELHPHSIIPGSVVFTLALLDFPLSLVLDTVVLPVTIPWASYRHFHAKTLSKEVQRLPMKEKERRQNTTGDICVP